MEYTNPLAAGDGSPLIRGFIRVNSTMRLSSKKLQWDALDLERHLVPPTEVPAGAIHGPLLVMWRGSAVARGEHLDCNGYYVPYAKRPGTMTLVKAGALPPVRTSTNSDFLLCALNRIFFNRVSDEVWEEQMVRSTNLARCIALDEPSFHDASLSRLLLLLEDEVKSDGASGSLYSEHLAHALVMRLFALANANASEINRRTVDRLPSKFLHQLIERIEANPLERFELATVAAECGYSYGRFVNAFRARTGLSPYRYITRLRLNLAKQLLPNRSLTLLEVALETGFASHAHFTHAFRQHFGYSPSDFRASLKK